MTINITVAGENTEWSSKYFHEFEQNKMSVHDAVSCDVCMKSSFSGNRYKCLICYDYDLCASCYESGTTSVQHLTQHPMQCVLARSDCELYYAGESASKIHMPRSFTCPFCSRMGFSDTTLNTHVSNEHADDSFEVVCPICAATPGGDPNRVTEDFIGHLMLEHRGANSDFESQTVAATTTAEPPVTHHVTTSGGVRGVGRMHYEAYQYHSPGSTISSLSPSGGQDTEAIESMSELLYQLTAIKGRSSTIQSISSQLQQLELQLQTTRHQLEGLPLRQSQQTSARQQLHQQQTSQLDESHSITLAHGLVSGSGVLGLSSLNREQTPELKGRRNKRYLLSRLDDVRLSEEEQENAEADAADKALFVQELLLNAFIEDLTSKTRVSKCDDAPNDLPECVESKCSAPVSAAGHQVKSSCDRKPAPTKHKEIVTRDNSATPGGKPTPHQSHDRMETHLQKPRIHPPQKVTKHKSGKESLPPKK